MNTKIAPSDQEADKAWDQIVQLARDHCLVISAYGGATILATPTEQRREGLREKVLRMHCMEECQQDQQAGDYNQKKKIAQEPMSDPKPEIDFDLFS